MRRTTHRRLPILIAIGVTLLACQLTPRAPEALVPAAAPTATPLSTAPPIVRNDDVPDCSADPDDPLFEVSPLAWEDFTGIIPLGAFSPPAYTFPTDHVYFFIRREDPSDHASLPASVPVYAPGHIWITSVSASEHLSANPPYTDYSILSWPNNTSVLQ